MHFYSTQVPTSPSNSIVNAKVSKCVTNYRSLSGRSLFLLNLLYHAIMELDNFCDLFTAKYLIKTGSLSCLEQDDGVYCDCQFYHRPGLSAGFSKQHQMMQRH